MRSVQISILLFGLSLLVYTVTGCQSRSTEINPAAPTSTKKISQTLSPTHTHIPTSTPTPTPTLTPVTPSPTTTPTSPPTMTHQERNVYIRELQKANAGCQLPCWWGITPGKTSWKDAEEMLKHLGDRIVSNIEPDGSVIHGTSGFNYEGEELYYNRVYIERDGIVDSIHILSIAESNEVAFQSIWESYDPRLLIRSFGVPSQAWLRTTSEKYGDKGTTGYRLWLFYDHLGFVIRYDGGVKHAPIYNICPTFENGTERIDWIAFLLQSPDNQLPLERIDQVGITDRYIRTLEDATGLSLEEFYQLFTQEEQPACFETPRNIWPPDHW